MPEESVTFLNNEGRRLFGIVHLPEGAPSGGRRLGVNLLCPGIKYRVAPGRLYVRIARALSRHGYTVLRFDPQGIGDSEGELPGGLTLGDIWVQIQEGRFVADVLAANDFFTARYGIESLLLAGNCGGAITALLAGAKDARVDGLCLVDPPVLLWSSGRSFADKAVAGGSKLHWLFSEYIRRLGSPRAWLRLVTLKTDYRALATVLVKKLRERLPASRRTGLPPDFDAVCERNRLNRGFFTGYREVASRGGKICCLLAGNDPGIDAFREFFVDWYLGRAGDGRMPHIEEIPAANHVYSLREWQDALVSAMLRTMGTGAASAAAQAKFGGDRAHNTAGPDAAY